MPRVRRPLVALIALILALAVGYGVNALRSAGAHSARPSIGPSSAGVALSSLPVQVADTLALIDKGGPFPYPRDDGVLFHNNEHLLPGEPDGYYREYTVPTPGSPDRGARRIITAKDGAVYYTGDHYEHFVRVIVHR